MFNLLRFCPTQVIKIYYEKKYESHLKFFAKIRSIWGRGGNEG